MDYYSSYLLHYGVKGMRWGHRKRYGETKRSLVKKINNARKYHRKYEDPYHTFNLSTGKNWDKVNKKHELEIESDPMAKGLRAKRDAAYKKAEKDYYDGNFESSEKYQNIGDQAQSDLTKRERTIGRKYADQYLQALLNDIGYKNIDLGRQMLLDYRIRAA